MATSKPSIAIVHGAWHPAKSFNELKWALEAKGFEVFVPSLPSVGKDSAQATCKTDMEHLQKTMIPYFEQGKEVVIACHSYGGVPAAWSTKDHSIAERAARGEIGGLKAILFMSGFAIPKRGMDLLTSFGGKLLDWQTKGPYYSGGCTMELLPSARDIFFNGVPDDIAAGMMEILEPQSQDSFETPAEYVASDVLIPKTYMLYEADNAVPIHLQEMMVSAAPGMKTIRCTSGHSAFLSQTAFCADVIERIASGTDL